MLETPGWGDASAGAKAALAAASKRLKAAGIDILTRENHAIVDSLESDIAEAFDLSMRIVDWEMRWFIRTLADRDIEKLSPHVRARMAAAEAMTRTEYLDAISLRDAIRSSYAEVASDCDACITLTATGPAPMGLKSTGNPKFVVPGSLLGIPTLTLPLLEDDGLPLGLQLVGFADRDADAFAVGSYLTNVLASQ